jgi:hypothetical protein
VAAELRFLEHRVSIAHDLEASATRRYQLDAGVGKRVTNLCRQTDGSGLVASNGAILDGDRHGSWVRVVRVAPEAADAVSAADLKY